MINDQLFYIVALMFPLLAALMSFSIDYSYKGLDYDQSTHNAKSAFRGALILSAMAVAGRVVGGVFGPPL